MLRNKVRHKSRVCAAKNINDGLRCQMTGSMNIIIKQVAAMPNQGVRLGRFSFGNIRKRLHIGLESVHGPTCFGSNPSLNALNHDANRFTAWLPHHLLDMANSSD